MGAQVVVQPMQLASTSNLPTDESVLPALSFLWLELTNLCNLECVHCYADSSPCPSKKDLLSPADYEEILSVAADLGCKQVQFVGGEPTLNRNLSSFIARAHSLGYEFIEVFTNLVSLSPELLRCFIQHQVRVATSVYSSSSLIHDQITKRIGSFTNTMRNIDKVMAAGLSLRAGVISMPINQNHVEETLGFLRGLGIQDVGTDRVREFGRALSENDKPTMQSLCGKCAGSTLCVSPDGGLSPCIMSKAWTIGTVLETPLRAMVQSSRLRDLRQEIYSHTFSQLKEDQIQAQIKFQSDCSPACFPSCSPSCIPSCAPSCFPSCHPACWPSNK